MEELKTVSKECVDCNILKVTVGTNCPKGGDAGHGGKTYLCFEDLGSTDMEIRRNGQLFELLFNGDAEARTLLKALKFAVYNLEEMLEINTLHGPVYTD